MKKTASLLIISLAFASGCQKEFLDRKPLGQLDYDNFFENEEQAVFAVNAVYHQFRQWDCIAFPWIGVTDILSDDADKGSTPTDALYMLEMDDFTFDATNPTFGGVWRGYYNAIARANLAIQRIPGVPMDEKLRARLVGECKFLRAYSYFLLAQWFGDLPIITKPLNGKEYYEQTRQPREQVFALIEQDLLEAVAALPEKREYAAKDLGRITKGAAKGMLAKLYMVKKDYVKAEKYCLEIINSNQYSLLERYDDVFLPQGENAAESIFEIQAAALPPADGVIGPGATPYNMIQGVRGIPNLGWGFNRPSDNLVGAYEPRDPRRKFTVLEPGDDLPDGSASVSDNPEIVGERFNRKAWVPAHTGLQDNGPGNIRILRYADILLLAAEALNENGKSAEALPYLNRVRARARKTAPNIPGLIVLPDVTVTAKNDLREKIYAERRIELAMEQHRWFDLARWGRLEKVLQAAGKNFVNGKHELLPIPQTEVDLTGGKIRQNRGY
jgi:starch-binding outer membrane protein, SusD/RagB family